MTATPNTYSTLPYDVARCEGRLLDVLGTTMRVPDMPCHACLRRTAPGHPTRQAYMQPPEFVEGECPSQIKPGL